MFVFAASAAAFSVTGIEHDILLVWNFGSLPEPRQRATLPVFHRSGHEPSWRAAPVTLAWFEAELCAMDALITLRLQMPALFPESDHPDRHSTSTAVQDSEGPFPAPRCPPFCRRAQRRFQLCYQKRVNLAIYG
jgi:hypothetical protein